MIERTYSNHLNYEYKAKIFANKYNKTFKKIIIDRNNKFIKFVNKTSTKSLLWRVLSDIPNNIISKSLHCASIILIF